MPSRRRRAIQPPSRGSRNPGSTRFQQLLKRGAEHVQSGGLLPTEGPEANALVADMLSFAAQRVFAGEERGVLAEWCATLRTRPLDDAAGLVCLAVSSVNSEHDPSPALSEPDLVDALEAAFRTLPDYSAEDWAVRRRDCARG